MSSFHQKILQEQRGPGTGAVHECQSHPKQACTARLFLLPGALTRHEAITALLMERRESMTVSCLCKGSTDVVTKHPVRHTPLPFPPTHTSKGCSMASLWSLPRHISIKLVVKEQWYTLLANQSRAAMFSCGLFADKLASCWLLQGSGAL